MRPLSGHWRSDGPLHLGDIGLGGATPLQESGLNNLSGADCDPAAGIFLPKDRGEHLKEQRQNRSEMGEDLSDIVAAGAKDGEDGIADAAFQRRSGETTVCFNVAISGPMAPRRFNSPASNGVRPRRMPLIRTLVLFTPWPRWPR